MDSHIRDKVQKILKAPYAGRVRLPEEYLDFLRETNGYTGEVGDAGFVSIWPVEEVVPTNEANHYRQWIPGLVLFGSNEGGEFYGFDMRGPTPKVAMVPSVPLDLKHAVEVGSSFLDFLERLARPP